MTVFDFIGNSRKAISDVPVVYFVEPTVDNIERIALDIRNNMYKSYYINFAGESSPEILKRLARSVMEIGRASSISKIIDRYINFLSLSPNMFTLNLPHISKKLNSTNDLDVTSALDAISIGLTSICTTLGAVPIIRSLPNGPAEYVSRNVTARLRKIIESNSSFANASGMRGKIGSQRPVLILLDRDFDIASGLVHSWTYLAMAAEHCQLHNNCISNLSNTGSSNSNTAIKFDPDDEFLVAHGHSTIAAAVEALQAEAKEFQALKSSLDAKTSHAEEDLTDLSKLAANAAHVAERKRKLDNHTAILTKIMTRVTDEKDMSAFCEFEQSFRGFTTDGQLLKQLEDVICSHSTATIEDKTRTLICALIGKPSAVLSHVDRLFDIAVASSNHQGSTNLCKKALAIVRSKLKTLSSAAGPSDYLSGGRVENAQSVTPGGSGAAPAVMGRQLGNLMSGLTAQMLTAAAGMAARIRGSETLLQKLVKSVMVNSDSSVGSAGSQLSMVDRMIYLDANLSSDAMASDPANRVKSAPRQVIVFTVGGATYTEAQLCLDVAANAGGIQLIFGATDICSQNEVLMEIAGE